MEFSEKIKYVREKLNMSQEDLARALNVSFATINRWENAKTKPINITLNAFDTFYGKKGLFLIKAKVSEVIMDYKGRA